MLENLYTIDWQNVLDIGSNPATYVPNLLQDLLSEDAQIQEDTVSALSKLAYAGRTSEAAIAIVPFLIEFLDYYHIPSHAAIMELIRRLLLETFGNREHAHSISLYNAILQHEHVFKRLAYHHKVDVRLSAFRLFLNLKSECEDSIGWCLEKIRDEYDIKAKAIQLRQAAQFFSENLHFQLYQTAYLEQATKLLTQQNAWIQVMALESIFRINQASIAPHLMDFWVDLIIRATSKNNIVGLSDIDLARIRASWWNFMQLPREQRIPVYLKLLKHSRQFNDLSRITSLLVGEVFPNEDTPAEFSALQKEVVAILADKSEFWDAEYEIGDSPPGNSFCYHGLPTTRAEMQKLVTW